MIFAVNAGLGVLKDKKRAETWRLRAQEAAREEHVANPERETENLTARQREERRRQLFAARSRGGGYKNR